mmetsp:Transcript_90267/g.239803  ORF Transcript_90267/g.239803 Transcript_90267/m.239803 type:complete len:210 (+) Transcript_90267:366-995(+)
MPPRSGCKSRPAPCSLCTWRTKVRRRKDLFSDLSGTVGRAGSRPLGAGLGGSTVPKWCCTIRNSSSRAFSLLRPARLRAWGSSCATTSICFSCAEHLKFFIQMWRSRRSSSTICLDGWTGSLILSSRMRDSSTGGKQTVPPMMPPGRAAHGWCRHPSSCKRCLGSTRMSERMRSWACALHSRPPHAWLWKLIRALRICSSIGSPRPSKG